MSANEWISLASYAVLGLALGAVSFAGLRWNTQLYLSGEGQIPWRPILLHMARLGLLGAVLVWAALQGAWPLLSVFGGLLVARPIVMTVLRPRP